MTEEDPTPGEYLVDWLSTLGLGVCIGLSLAHVWGLL